VSGDALVLSIAAASIVAKVVRDRLMVQIGAAHPGYGFERHMGYSVPEHFRALARLGPTVHHRRSFAPVATLMGEDVTDEALEALAGHTLLAETLTGDAPAGDMPPGELAEPLGPAG
jgi:ribonuclease HII